MTWIGDWMDDKCAKYRLVEVCAIYNQGFATQVLSVINEYLRLSSFELAFVLCESGALSTEPPPASILTSCCAQYLSRPS